MLSFFFAPCFRAVPQETGWVRCGWTDRFLQFKHIPEAGVEKKISDYLADCSKISQELFTLTQ
jgi:hypothetical protein